MTAVDVSQEKRYLLIGVVLVLMSFLPKYGTVLGIVGLVLQYVAFRGYDEKLGLPEGRKYFLRSLVAGVLGLFVAIGAVFLVAISYVGWTESGSHGNFVSVAPVTTYYGNTTVITTELGVGSNVDHAILLSVVLVVLALWAAFVISVYYSTKAFLALGKYFGIEEFEKYRTFALAAWIPMPFWLVLVVVGWVIFVILDVISLVYLIMGIEKLPDKAEKKESEIEFTGNSPVIY